MAITGLILTNPGMCLILTNPGMCLLPTTRVCASYPPPGYMPLRLYTTRVYATQVIHHPGMYTTRVCTPCPFLYTHPVPPRLYLRLPTTAGVYHATALGTQGGGEEALGSTIGLIRRREAFCAPCPPFPVMIVMLSVRRTGGSSEDKL